MAFRVMASLGLVACGVAGTMAWRSGMWGLLTGAILTALWLCALDWWTPALPTGAAPPPADEGDAAADATVLRILLDAAPTPLLGLEDGTVRALNRTARALFETDDRILPVPATLNDTTATHFRHEGRGWRIDRVTVAEGRGVAALIDIEQEERVAEARATAELIQVLGHELLNGLAPIASLAESALAASDRPAIDRALLHEILGTLARRAESLQRFTEAYRALARLPEPTPQRVPLRPLVDDLARLFDGAWPTLSLTVEIDADADADADWPLDRDQMNQAVWALLQNAAEAVTDHRTADPRVTLRLTRVDTALAIDVADNGIGVPPGNSGRIFRPFHTTKPEGTGIGLSLARQIALAHGGTLTLVPGGETVFRLLLPPVPSLRT